MSFFSSLQSALQQQKGMRVVFDGENPIGIASDPRRNDSELDCKIAQVIADRLEKLERVSPADGLNHEAVFSTKKFLKGVSKDALQDPRVVRCFSELLAFKLGIPSTAFEKSPGFEKFSSNPPLERYLAEYRHTLRLSPTGEVEILESGSYRPWGEVKDIAAPKEKENHSRYQPWFYGPEGLQNKNMFRWDDLTPYKKEIPSDRYLFEFCCCCEETPRFVGDHSWLRLIDPEGNVYSVGKYRPYKTDPKHQAKNPMRVQKGLLMSPDVSEFWPTRIHRIPIEITPEEFEEMKRNIEEDNRQDLETFQLVNDNCTKYVEKIAAVAHIRLPYTEKPAWRLLAPKMEKPVDVLTPWLPGCVKQLSSSATTLALQSCLLWQGAYKVDKEVARESVRPMICGSKDLMDVESLKIGHPHNVAYRTLPAVLKWRGHEIRHLENRKQTAATEEEKRRLDAQIESMQFALPDSMKATTRRGSQW